MTLVLTEQPQYTLLQWAAEKLRLPTGMWVPESKAIGVLDSDTGAIRAVMVLTRFTGEGLEASFVSDGTKRWSTRSILTQLITAPYFLFPCDRIWVRVSAQDRDTQVLALRIGLDFVARMPGAMPSGEDAVLFTMTRESQPLVRQPEGEKSDGGQ